MENTILKFPSKGTITDEVIQPEVGKGITTLNQLRRTIRKFDINSIKYNTGDRFLDYLFYQKEENKEPILNLNADFFTRVFNKKKDKFETVIKLHIIKDRFGNYRNALSRKLRDTFPVNTDIGIYSLEKYYCTYTGVLIYACKNRGTILFVSYAQLEDKNEPNFFQNWFRSIIDPSINTNWESNREIKEYEFYIQTVTYEKIKVSEINIDLARRKVMKEDASLTHYNPNNLREGSRSLICDKKVSFL